MIEKLKQQFAKPPEEFTPIPFWFWNDDLSKEEIIRQIHDFRAKGVSGFVIHPRIGLPRTMPYLSEPYMELVEAAVAEASRLGMTVILYDEGMYPSGAANGLVVKRNPEYASRGLRMAEYPCTEGTMRIPLELAAGEALLSVQAVRKLSDKEMAPDSAIVLDCDQDSVEFTPPAEGDWSLLLFVETFSRGTIRGIHSGQDDREPDAPKAADLLNPEAVQSFISLTHEAYYKRLGKYFGSTIIAMFTDEPDMLGRGHVRGLKPWTSGLMRDFLEHEGKECELPELWFDAGEQTLRIRARYEQTVRERMTRSYYKPLSDWCKAHGIALTGHPAKSDDIGLLEHFQIPGQDVVWRFIAPEEGKAIDGAHSTMGKCSSDAARHRGRRRNLNECFGVCGKESGWAFNADNMKWYLDWLFVRGVNLICPHAFYYSIRDERRNERPPDVGPNNIWWADYSLFSTYIKRLSWLMTDSVNAAEVAVLAQAERLPWKIVKPLYERQIEFNYLEEDHLNSICQIVDGTVRIANQTYKALLIEDGGVVSPASWEMLRAFVRQGGIVIELGDGSGDDSKKIGQHHVGQTMEIPLLLDRLIGSDPLFAPACDSLRFSRVTKDGTSFLVVVNEGETRFEGILQTKLHGYAEIWSPWTGEVSQARSEQTEDGLSIGITVERRECLVIAVDPGQDAAGTNTVRREVLQRWELTAGWRLHDSRSATSRQLSDLSSWTEWEGMEHFSGTMIYENSFTIDPSLLYNGISLDLGDTHELARVSINGWEAGVRMWKPYVFEIGKDVHPGPNELRIEVTNSLANYYDNKSLPSGLLGPVSLIFYRNVPKGGDSA